MQGSKADPRTDANGAAVSSACDVTLVALAVGSVGGMERVLEELVIGLNRLGHHVTVIARSCELPEDVEVTFHRVRGPRCPFLVSYPWFMLAGSIAVRRWRRGIVQANGAIVLNRVDTIAVHYCHQVGRATPGRPTTLFRGYVRVVGLVKRVAERLCYRANGSAMFVCVSNGVADEMREHYPMLADRVVTIHNGVDTEAFAPGVRKHEALALRATLDILEGRALAAFIGGEWGRKGLRLVLEALALAPGWDLIVAGRGDERRYREIADSLGVGKAVHWLGVTRDVQVVYELADAFVLPSSYETFSLVTFEAAASGLPVVVTPVSGVRELIEDEKNGFLITPDSRVIAQRLTQLSEDPALRTRMGQAARRSALRFTWDVMVAEHHRLYSRLASNAS